MGATIDSALDSASPFSLYSGVVAFYLERDGGGCLTALRAGSALRTSEALSDGFTVGATDELILSDKERSTLGIPEGASDKLTVGAADEITLGNPDGYALVTPKGIADRFTVEGDDGVILGSAEGLTLERTDGISD